MKGYCSKHSFIIEVRFIITSSIYWVLSLAVSFEKVCFSLPYQTRDERLGQGFPNLLTTRLFSDKQKFPRFFF